MIGMFVASAILLSISLIFPASIPFLAPIAKPLIVDMGRKLADTMSTLITAGIGAICAHFVNKAKKDIQKQVNKLSPCSEANSPTTEPIKALRSCSF